MNFKLECSIAYRYVITKMLNGLGHKTSEEANFLIVEEGYDQPRDKLCICFNQETLPELMALFEGSQAKLNYIVGYIDDISTIIELEKIIYFNANNNTVYCLTETGIYKTKKKLYELENNLDPSQFSRINKSQIVNIYHIKSIIPWFNNRLLLKMKHSDVELEVSKNHVKNFKSNLGM